jgi:hypothetical protein
MSDTDLPLRALLSRSPIFKSFYDDRVSFIIGGRNIQLNLCYMGEGFPLKHHREHLVFLHLHNKIVNLRCVSTNILNTVHIELLFKWAESMAQPPKTSVMYSYENR